MRLTAILPFSILLASCASTASTEKFNVDQALEYCNTQVHRSLAALGADSTDYTMMPRNIQGTDSAWACRKASPDEWCSGFWPGILWYDFESSRDEIVREEAERYTEALEYLSRRPAFDHDLGFLMFCSYGNAYRLTGSPKFRDIILASADTLATLFNPKVGTILSWPRNVEMLGGHNTIMDNMINLEMLFWASKNGGDKRLYDIALKHAETTMEYHFRPDGTCYHVAVYDPESGKFIKGMTHQGYSDSSTWARGQAWAVYGYTMVFRETQDRRFLDFACKVTDAYLRRLPDDYVPYWDFDDPAIPDAPRDASAACVVASALLELQAYVTPEKRDEYRDAAVKMLASLSSEEYRSGDKRHSFLDHSTGHKPAGSEIDAAIVYADYYYIEALLRLKKLETNSAVLANL
ncbi:MAG: glycoside hydrolase family 88 protein [Muribaculaceae bacterium]|nr:glycoside hydrolase family 88 protein [Muribaculaceae bacterium]